MAEARCPLFTSLKREDWSGYLIRLNLHFRCKKVEDAELKHAAFVSNMGDQLYKVAERVMQQSLSKSLVDCSYEQITEQLTKHFKPMDNVNSCKNLFFHREKKSTEGVEEYAEALIELAQKCKFQGEVRKVILRDRFLTGLNNTKMQTVLFALDPTPDFEELMAKAKIQENITGDVQAVNKGAAEDSESSKVNSVSKFTGSKNKNKSDKKWVDNKTSKGGQGKTGGSCFRCKSIGHLADSCWAKNKKCFNCQIVGHTQNACRKPKENKIKSVKGKPNGESSETDSDSLADRDEYSYTVKAVGSCLTGGFDPRRPILLKLKINGVSCNLEMDSGSCRTLINDDMLSKLFKTDPKSRPTIDSKPMKPLEDYNGGIIPVLGQATVCVEYEGQKCVLPFTVASRGPSIIGKDWLWHFKPDLFVTNVKSVQISDVDLGFEIKKLNEEFSDIFEARPDGSTITVGVTMIDNPKPVFCKVRSVPYALSDKVEAQLRDQVHRGIYTVVPNSKWATPIVVVAKPGGDVRICGDYKITVNPQIVCDGHPIPKIKDLFAKLGGGLLYTKLDMAEAYLQYQADENLQEISTLITPIGLLKPRCLSFGISSAPAIFQGKQDELLCGIPGVANFFDDTTVTGSSNFDHLQSLRKVYQVFRDNGLTLNRKKCLFGAESVDVLGHKISREGIRPKGDNIEAIKNAPRPTSVTQVRSFVGMLNYYGGHVSNISSQMAPLFRLMQKDAKFEWTSECENVFQTAKKWLSSDAVLVHYDPTKPICLSCDASIEGVGAVLSHVIEGEERPISYASRTLQKPERNYSNIEREALGVIFGVKKFHQYVYGRKFVIYTDHKPLVVLFSGQHETPVLGSPRIQFWSSLLACYMYEIVYRPGVKNGNADCLSRLPLTKTVASIAKTDFESVLLVSISQLPIQPKQIKLWTDRDPTLCKVINFTQRGWFEKSVEPGLNVFKQKEGELHVLQGCLMWGHRVVVPFKGQKSVLDFLHAGHPGIERMKRVARMHVWWPGIDGEIEKLVSECDFCLSKSAKPAPAPLMSREWPTEKWIRIHMDLAKFQGVDFLVVVDAFSKWVEIRILPGTLCENVLFMLRSIFGQFGLPVEIVSDNGPQFDCAEFREFCHKNGIKFSPVTPAHPQANGLAERVVRTLKGGLKSQKGDMSTRLDRFLFHYRTTPHSSTGETPSNLFLGREIRCHLNILKPDWGLKLADSQNRNVSNRAKKAKPRNLEIGDFVKVSLMRKNKTTWENGLIIAKRGLTAFDVKLESNGKVFKRHLNEIILNTAGGIVQGERGNDPNELIFPKPTPITHLPTIADITVFSGSDAPTQTVPPGINRRSNRSRVPPRR